MNFRAGSRDEPEINLIPFIDILLVVLIFLVLTTTYSKFTQLQVSLPVAEAQVLQSKPTEVVVAISSDGRYAVNQRLLEGGGVDLLTRALSDATRGNARAPVVISADSAATHQSVVNVMEAARRAGLVQITFATRQGASSRGQPSNPAPPQDRSAQRQARWQASVQQRGLQAWCLWPLSLLYGTLVRLRRWLYGLGVFRTHWLPVPVIVVGNVVVGGAGKTPTVVALVQHLQGLGWRPGVVSRGYGRQGSATLEVQPDTPAQASGDEPALIRRTTGVLVFVAVRRIDAARALLAAHPAVDVLLCDDGLQHLALGRDLSVVVFDERGTGNGWLLPAGLLREPWPGSAARWGHQTLVLQQHREGGEPAPAPPLPQGRRAFRATRRLADQVVGPAGERLALDQLQGLPITAVAGIARPVAFFDMLRARGLSIAHEVALPDHADAAAYASLAGGSGTLVCTEKDAVKLFAARASLPDLAQRAAWAVPLELAPEPAFFSAVEARLAQLSSSHGHQTA